MTKENQKTSHLDVMPAFAKFVGNINDEGFMEELPSEMQEICDRLLETEQANDLEVRAKMLRCLNLIRQFSKTMQPFTPEQVNIACKEHGYV